MERCYVYAVVCPFCENPLYIGSSTDPELRMLQHVHPGKETNFYFRFLRMIGHLPDYIILEQCEHGKRLDREAFWIWFYISQNCELLNKSYTKRAPAHVWLRKEWYEDLGADIFECDECWHIRYMHVIPSEIRQLHEAGLNQKSVRAILETAGK